MRRWPLAAAVLLVATLSPTLSPQPVGAQEADDQQPSDTTDIVSLEPLVVQGRIDDLTGLAVTASQGLVGHEDLRLRPLAREGEILETVPGLIMTQHSGDGKSNQLFVRGFNLDHGTDFSARVEGMPVNIVSHAHGQGYTDLNFIIPELVDYVDYRLGSYYAEIGDFGSAGGAHLRLRRSLSEPLVSAGLGENGFVRAAAAGSTQAGSGELLVGGEIKRYDGPWAVPQGLYKRSAVGRFTWQSGPSTFSILAMAYDNDWNASDQIPRRLIRDGTVGRYGQVDETLGGASSRWSLSGSWTREGGERSRQLEVYGIRYDLDLWSNFTYFLDDPVDGDQIHQEDDGRYTVGANGVWIREVGGGGPGVDGREAAGSASHQLTLGLQTRADRASVALRRTEGRRHLSTVRSDDIMEWGTGAFAELESEWGGAFRTVLGIRGDHYRFDVESDLAANSGDASGSIASANASLIYAPADFTELYLSAGQGFHSNDARGTVQSVDPATGDPVEPVDPLVRSESGEIGLRATPTGGWRTTLAAWTVSLDSELLFVGDAGTTEPSDASSRLGVTWTNFYRIRPELSVDLDISLVRARISDAAGGGDRIPGAMERVITGGLTWEPGEAGPYGALRLRHFGEYPLVEDGSVRAPPTSLLNLNVGWRFGGLRLGASVLNVLDAEASDIQYLYRSRIPGDPPGGVESVHLHPVEPRQLRLTASWGV